MTSELVEQDWKRGRLSGTLQVVNSFQENIIHLGWRSQSRSSSDSGQGIYAGTNFETCLKQVWKLTPTQWQFLRICKEQKVDHVAVYVAGFKIEPVHLRRLSWLPPLSRCHFFANYQRYSFHLCEGVGGKLDKWLKILKRGLRRNLVIVSLNCRGIGNHHLELWIVYLTIKACHASASINTPWDQWFGLFGMGSDTIMLSLICTIMEPISIAACVGLL